VADLITLQEARQYMGFPADTAQDTALASIIAAASQAVRSRCSRDFDLRAYTEIRNGNGRRSIMAMRSPVAASPAPAATENGTTLAVSTGYAPTADVIVDLDDGLFYRQPGQTQVPGSSVYYPGRWARGVQNVVLTYTAGYSAIPDDLKLVVKELCAMYWKHTDRKEWNIMSRSDGQRSVNLLDKLPERHRDILDLYTRPFAPEP